MTRFMLVTGMKPGFLSGRGPRLSKTATCGSTCKRNTSGSNGKVQVTDLKQQLWPSGKEKIPIFRRLKVERPKGVML